ncbi:MAG: DNA primase [Deltaproteobacteria bacterium]|nr:DNA primase [Deltaproteobacteria bacterium]MBK9648581.1 DNA primase [Deltaproteobacteria bacterium]
MQIPRALIDEIRERTDIAEVIGQAVTLRSQGGRSVGLCPFHQEKSPSFHVLRDKQIYHCFGCKESGDVFTFLMKTQGLSFTEAVKELAGPAGITLEERQLDPKERAKMQARASLHDACAFAAEWFHTNLLSRPEGLAAREALKARGCGVETWKRFRLGYAPDRWTGLLDHLQSRGVPPELAIRAGLARKNEQRGSAYDFFRDRLMIPILDRRDRPIAFGGRILSGEGPKYINSSETEIYEKSSTLYGLSLGRAAIQRKDRVIVVEGYFDAISLAQAGFEEVVATCGTALTEGHLEQIRRLTTTVIALFDTDEAGKRAAERALPMFLGVGVEPRHLELPGAKDPDEYVQKNGAAAFEQRLSSARSLVEVVIGWSAQRHGSTPAGRQRSVTEILPLLLQMPPIQREAAVARAAGLLGVGELALRELIGRRRDEPARPAGVKPRFVGNAELNRLLWLLIHFPQETAPVLLAIPDPQIVTDHPEVGFVIHQLLDGVSLASLREDLADIDVKRLLGDIAMREGLCDRERAATMAAQIVARLEGKAVNERLSALQRELSACDPTLDRPRYLALLSEQQEMVRRKQELVRITGPMR